MVQGDAYSLGVTIKNNGQAVEIDDIEKVEMTLLYLQKYYPGKITYEDGKFYFHEDMEAFCKPLGLTPSYDGMTITVG